MASNGKVPDQSLVDSFIDSLVDKLLKAENSECEILVDAIFRQNFSPNMVYTLVFAPAMRTIGDLWHDGKITVAHEHLASQIIKDLVDVVSDKSPQLPTNNMSALITSVGGERHSLASGMFANLLILGGWKVYYLGPETPAKDVSIYVTQNAIDVVGLSISVEANITNALECVDSLNALETPPLILMGGVAVVENADKFNLCHVVADFAEGMDILDGILGIPKGSQSLSQMLQGVGGNIQTTRTARGMNQGELAERAGVDRAYISLVENGKQNLTMSALVKLADALSIPVSSIIPNDNYRR